MAINADSYNETDDVDSALGIDPTCDICGKYIKVGDDVIQTTTGKVINPYGELGIREVSYHLIHVDCEVK